MTVYIYFHVSKFKVECFPIFKNQIPNSERVINTYTFIVIYLNDKSLKFKIYVV